MTPGREQQRYDGHRVVVARQQPERSRHRRLGVIEVANGDVHTRQLGAHEVCDRLRRRLRGRFPRAVGDEEQQPRLMDGRSGR